MKKVLVIGANGFFGRHLMQELANSRKWEAFNSRDYKVDLLQPNSIPAAIERVKPDAVVNLAAFSTLDVDDIPAIYRLNGLAVVDLLDVLRACGFAGRFVHTSSCLVYGARTPVPVDETQPLDPQHHYAIAKAMADRCCIAYRDTLDTVVARPFNCIGLGQPDRYVVPKIVKHFRDQAEEIVLGNTGSQRDFVDVRDMARMFATLLDAQKTPDVVNFCHGEAHTIEEVVKIVSELAGQALQVKGVDHLLRESDNPHLIGSAARLHSLGFVRRYSLRDTLQWMLAA